MRVPMEQYLRDLAANLLRMSRSTLDIGTARKLRELAADVVGRAEELETEQDDGEGR